MSIKIRYNIPAVLSAHQEARVQYEQMQALEQLEQMNKAVAKATERAHMAMLGLAASEGFSINPGNTENRKGVKPKAEESATTRLDWVAAFLDAGRRR